VAPSFVKLGVTHSLAFERSLYARHVAGAAEETTIVSILPNDVSLQVVEDTWAALVAVDAECRIRVFNREAARVTGVAADAVLGTRLCNALWPMGCGDDRAACPCRWALTGNERRLQPREVTVRVGERTLDILLGIRPTRMAAGEPGALLTFIDLAHRRVQEETRNALVAEMFHELRSPLCSISMAAHFLSVDWETLPSERLRGFVETIEQNSSALLADLNDLLNRSTYTVDVPTITARPTDLLNSIEAAVEKLEPLLHERGQSVRLDVPDLPLLWADERRIEQVLVNMLANANKYSDDDDEIVVAAREEAGTVRVSVEDHGPGILPHDRARIFERFYRASSTSTTVTGAGLGLAIVRRVVEAHGGRIGVDDSIPHGATFWFTLPSSPIHG